MKTLSVLSDMSTSNESESKEDREGSRPIQSPPRVERVALSPTAVSKIDLWIRSVVSTKPGVEITRRDIVEWLILGQPESLSLSQQKDLAQAHYNELRFLHYAMRELKAARTRGEPIALEDLMTEVPRAVRVKEKSDASRKKGAPKAETKTVLPLDQTSGDS